MEVPAGERVVQLPDRGGHGGRERDREEVPLAEDVARLGQHRTRHCQLWIRAVALLQ